MNLILKLVVKWMRSYQNTEDIAFKYYADRTLNIGKLVNYFDAQVQMMQLCIKYFSGRWLGM